MCPKNRQVNALAAEQVGENLGDHTLGYDGVTSIRGEGPHSQQVMYLLSIGFLLIPLLLTNLTPLPPLLLLFFSRQCIGSNLVCACTANGLLGRCATDTADGLGMVLRFWGSCRGHGRSPRAR